MELNTAMTLEEAIEACRDGLKGSFKMEVIPCTYNPNLYNVFADGIPIVPTESVTVYEDEATCLNYSLQWGRKHSGTYYVRWSTPKNDRAVEMTLQSRPFTEDELEMEEIRFCQDNGLQCKALFIDIDWTPFPNGPYPFHKVRGSENPRELNLRGCPMGCGRVLRDHERHCPDCIPSYGGQSLYNEVGGR